jgi:hypothetical protein
MPNPNDTLQREILPIPDVTPVSTTTYDAKDPETHYPLIVPLRPPANAPNVLIVLIDDVGFGASSAFGGPIATPTFEKLAAGGLKYNRFLHYRALLTNTGRVVGRTQSPLCRHGLDHGARDVGAGAEFPSAEHVRAACRNTQAGRAATRGDGDSITSAQEKP